MNHEIIEATNADGRTEYRLEINGRLWGTYSHCERRFVERIAARILEPRCSRA
jgi:hypothetical protein